jgi:glyoxylase-like metal-dependent hydrolase (beta-lactamase superfamily II)
VTGSGLEPAPDRVPEAGQATALSDLVVRVTAGNPGMMTGPGTNSYVVGTRQLVVVDPGPDEPAHLDTLADMGAGRIRWIVVTHTHRDHAPGAAGLATRTGAEVIGFDARDGFVPARAVGEGFELTGPDFALRAVHTPGHASNHLCWLLVGAHTLFSGDHVMQGSTVVIRPPDGDMGHYLASLRRLIALAPGIERIAPGHGALIDDPVASMAMIIVHRLERQRAVADALARARRATVDALLPGVYADVDEDRYHVARQSLWAHLRKLAQDGLAASDDADDPAAEWAWVA